ncbi:MAG: DNA topoisomerase IV subunit A [Acidilobaceae archaeon]|nr:DNA topoisomerase IV subunit A [Acidilobaceae archaeon]MCX8165666.1 DNA topoisomerase IV subunit A [Acidilobaceae archaeon]MDW7974091.1 DNA topoisomerase IV subunit A [Sulfolobales archaeon]
MDRADAEARRRAALAIRQKLLPLLKEIEKGNPPKLVIPKRTFSNTNFDKEKGFLVMGEETLERHLLDAGEARRFMQTILMASIIYQALVENEYPTIRDLYYRGKHTITYMDLAGKVKEENTWDEQDESDAVLRDIEVMTDLLREEMLILSKEKGKMVGDMRIRSGPDVIDLSKLGHGAYAIESTPDLIEFLDVNAEFVLVVEKDAVFQQLHRIGFWKQYKCLLMTGAGQPDRATRRLVRRLNEELGLPVYVITDSDPYGWNIFSVFKVGSITLSYESERLATPKARFLGVSMTDIFGDKGKKPYLTAEERKNFIIKAKDADVKRAKDLQQYPWFQTKKWQREIELFLEKKAKLEIEALVGKGLKFLAHKYIPEKIQGGDWIE